MIITRGNSHQAKFMVAGKTYRQSFPTYEEAEDWEADVRRRLKRGQPLNEVAPKLGGRDSGSIGNAIRSVIANHWGPAKGGKGQIANANMFLKWVGANVSITEALSKKSTDDFSFHLREERGVGGKTHNRYMSMLRVLADKSGHKLGFDLPHTKEGSGRVRFFTKAEFDAVVSFFEHSGFFRERDFFIFLCDTGARPWGEGETLEWSEVGGGQVVFIADKTKTYKTRAVPLSKRAEAAIERQRGLGLPGPWSGYKSRTMSDYWKLVKAAIPQLEDTVWYTCRHTCASWQVQKGVPIYDVMTWMGHSSIHMTQKYAHLAPGHLRNNLVAFED